MYKKKNVKTAFVYKTLIYSYLQDKSKSRNKNVEISLLNCEQFKFI